MAKLRIEAIGRGIIDLYTEHICFVSKCPCGDFVELHTDGGYDLKVKRSDYELIDALSVDFLGNNKINSDNKRKKGR